jgi:hypothetical protein
MYDPPAYVWALTIAGPTAIAAATCIALDGGAVRAGLGRRRAGLLGGAAAILLGGWFNASAMIASHGWYDTRSSQVPWLPIEYPDQPTPARPGHRRRRAADARPAHHVPGHARPSPTASAASRGPLISGAPPRAAVTQRPATRARRRTDAGEKTIKPEINAPKGTPRRRRHSHRPPITTS